MKTGAHGGVLNVRFVNRLFRQLKWICGLKQLLKTGKRFFNYNTSKLYFWIWFRKWWRNYKLALLWRI